MNHLAPNYAPLPITVTAGEGAWVVSADGRRLLDGLAGYSALNFGHRHPELIDAATTQLSTLTLTGRAFGNDRLEPFAAALSDLTGKDMVLPMNSGAEAVESALKAARRWGYATRGIAEDQAVIIVMDGNFHGRTTTIVSFSGDETAREGFGPFTPGFRSVPFGDAEAVAQALAEEPNAVAVLAEPIQGEAGVILPPEDFLPRLRALCDEHEVLLMLDEIQSGLGRTGTTFAHELSGITPDVLILGKALGGGILPVSAVCADASVLGLLGPGSHGSTFGGNPLAAAVGLRVIELLRAGDLQERAARLGVVFAERLRALVGHGATAVRVRGLWAGVDIDPELMDGHACAEVLLAKGVLAKETHGQTIRLSPPLVISEEDLVWLTDQLRDVLVEAEGKNR